MATAQQAADTNILPREHWVLSEKSARGVAVLVHGLNNRSEIMNAVGRIFADSGYHLLFVRLRGHRGEGWERVNYAREWSDDVRRAIAEAAKRFPELPIVFAGYSLGGTLAATAESSSVKAFLLFAPAIKLNPRRKILRLLSPFRFLGFSLPSLAPEQWRMNTTTSLHAYEGLNTLGKNFSAKFFTRPTALFFDPDDSLVSYNLSTQWLNKHPTEKLRIIQTSGISSPAHLVVDPAVRGETSWKAMAAEIEKVLAAIS